jgi:predicted lipoprotein with Yx(FWY)xxD motif
MKTIALMLLVGLLAVAGCGGDDDAPASGGSDEPAMKKEEGATKKDDAAMQKDDAAMKKEDAAMEEGKGTAITLGDSEFGSMLFDSSRHAIYVFENDRDDETVCYGECAEAWPPVFTNGTPKAGKGVDASLLGTVKRRDGKLQVTYAGKPLYFYAHERPGEVKCHNVNLNGGFWWVVGPEGDPLT